jgi:hypothetical protein
MYKNFKISEEEKRQILEMHQSRGYKKPLNENINYDEPILRNKDMYDADDERYDDDEYEPVGQTWERETYFNSYDGTPIEKMIGGIDFSDPKAKDLANKYLTLRVAQLAGMWDNKGGVDYESHKYFNGGRIVGDSGFIKDVIFQIKRNYTNKFTELTDKIIEDAIFDIEDRGN